VRAYPADEVARAYRGRIWLTLGYESWQEYCDCELDGFKLPSRAERPQIVGELTHRHGLSQRAVAEALGVDQSTVSRDMAGDANASPAIGKDGKVYPRRKSATPDDAPSVDAGASLSPSTRFHCDGDDGFDRGRKTLGNYLHNLRLGATTPERQDRLIKQLERALDQLRKARGL
jgi:transcriptional regulator with XRE-family HTH domain